MHAPGKPPAREAGHLRRLDGCDGIPHLLAACTDGNPAYLVLRAHGSNLRQVQRLQRDGRLPADWVRDAGRDVVAALHQVHERGLVHGDVKPGNILLYSDFDSDIRCVLADFGLARRIGAASTPPGAPDQVADNRTDAQPPPPRIRGTLRYASLRTHGGARPGPHDDLWSLWYSMIDLLLGRLPWAATNDRAAVLQAKLAFDGQHAALPPALQAFAACLDGSARRGGRAGIDGIDGAAAAGAMPDHAALIACIDGLV